MVIYSYLIKERVLLQGLESKIEDISEEDCSAAEENPEFLGMNLRRDKIVEKMFAAYEQY